jgi:hypothetical protein
MNESLEMPALLERQKHAKNVFVELLTSVSPEVKDALTALYDLVEIDLQVAQAEKAEA